MSKITYQIKTNDFEFIAVELEGISHDEAVKNFNDLKSSWEQSQVLKSELPRKDWNKILDKYLRGEGISETDHALLGKAQQWMLHELDKSRTRMKPTDESEA